MLQVSVIGDEQAHISTLMAFLLTSVGLRITDCTCGVNEGMQF